MHFSILRTPVESKHSQRPLLKRCDFYQQHETKYPLGKDLEEAETGLSKSWNATDLID